MKIFGVYSYTHIGVYNLREKRIRENNRTYDFCGEGVSVIFV
jgi:hypothetical protein